MEYRTTRIYVETYEYLRAKAIKNRRTIVRTLAMIVDEHKTKGEKV